MLLPNEHSSRAVPTGASGVVILNIPSLDGSISENMNIDYAEKGILKDKLPFQQYTN